MENFICCHHNQILTRRHIENTPQCCHFSACLSCIAGSAETQPTWDGNCSTGSRSCSLAPTGSTSSTHTHLVTQSAITSSKAQVDHATETSSELVCTSIFQFWEDEPMSGLYYCFQSWFCSLNHFACSSLIPFPICCFVFVFRMAMQYQFSTQPLLLVESYYCPLWIIPFHCFSVLLCEQVQTCR